LLAAKPVARRAVGTAHARVAVGREIGMGVISDYFRAADAREAVRALEMTDGVGPFSPAGGIDGRGAKGVGPWGVLGMVIAFSRRVPWEPGLVPTTLVWPDPGAAEMSKEQYDELHEDSPLKTGPWLQQLDSSARDALASVDDARMLELAAKWARIEEMRG